jgi:phosphoribosylanthranilate isomerase
MVRVKICGCRSLDHAFAAAEAGADFVGFVFAESRRHIEPSEAAEIVRALGEPVGRFELETPPAVCRTEAIDLSSWFEHGAAALERLSQRKRPLTVGVFADNDPEEINEIVDECGIDLIQLSGHESWGACLLANRQVIKTIRLPENEPTAAAITRIEAGSALAVMLDTTSPGAGKKVDWSAATGVSSALPVWLAGGLTPENVAEAITTVRPWCVDVSTGVETDGVKDLTKIRAFVKAAKGAPRDV